MRLLIQGDKYAETVIAEPFTIEGSSEQFAVHRAIRADLLKGEWSATHVESGFSIGRGDTLEEAVENARTQWLAKTPGEIAEARARAHEINAARRQANGEAPA